jgi:hypothetical protein
MNAGVVRGAVFATVVTAFVPTVLATAPFDFGFGSHGGPIRTGVVAGMNTLDPASCRGCHADVYAEWAGSMHARSFVDPVFRAELATTAEGTPCRTCHAPLAPVSETTGALHDIGVACASCHVRDGMILATRPPRGETPHPTRVVPELDDTAFCASCHDFRFPDRTAARAISYDPDTLQQSTATEWARSRHAREGLTCVSCHMPSRARASGRAGTSHVLRSLEDHAFVRDALTVSARATTTRSGTRLFLRLEVRGAGHAVPTGDIFRELRIRAWNGPREVVRTLRRHFAEQRTARGWVLRDSVDERVMPDEPKEVVLELPPSAAEVHYAIEILRLDLGDARRRGLPDDVVIVPVAEGAVTPVARRR